MTEELQNFAALRSRYEAFPPGPKAELRRAPEPDDLGLTTAFYRLFPDERPNERHQRLAFLLPWCPHRPHAKALGAQLASEGVSEARVLQAARAKSPLDIIQLRRLVMHIEPTVDWNEFGRMLWFWNDRSKRQLVEDFYLTLFSPAKGDKK